MSEQVIYNSCDPKKYVKHNFHNEKVNQWLIENHTGGDGSRQWGHGYGDEFGQCDCHEKDEEYEFYYDKYDYEELIKAIPQLTEGEKEELEGVGSIRVYICPDCGEWSVDGDNC